MLICTVVVVVAFFLPWVSIQSEQVGMVSKLLTGKNQTNIASISAFQVPILANGPESRLMISIIKIFNPGITNADKKSFLIWAIPALAVVLLAVSHSFGKNKWVNLVIGILGVVIFAGVTFKLLTTDLDKMVLKVAIGLGLWLTLFGFLGMGILSSIKFFFAKKAA